MCLSFFIETEMTNTQKIKLRKLCVLLCIVAVYVAMFMKLTKIYVCLELFYKIYVCIKCLYRMFV